MLQSYRGQKLVIQKLSQENFDVIAVNSKSQVEWELSSFEVKQVL